MSIDKRDELIAGIYDAALGVLTWEEVLVALAGATGCRQTGLEVHDPYTGVIERRTPLCAPEYQASYRAYWGEQVSLYRKTDRFPLGRVFRSAEIFDMNAYRQSAFYNDWWRPQGTGGDTLLANVVTDGRATAVLAAYKPYAAPHFTDKEQRLFKLAVQHFIRAIEIHRRLHLAKARQSLAPLSAAPEGCVIIDREGRVLVADEAAHCRLIAAGLVQTGDGRERIDQTEPAVRRLIVEAVGRVDQRGRDGSLLRITAAPLREPVGDAWLAIDRPAVVLHVATPEDAARERLARLASEHGLTPAEAAVALEAAKGDGRGAVAKRLGIRETTVRSHLSAIYDKTGVRRQAGLVWLVEGR
jgi:DNA-binding CsgD family transcriptional regulator